MTTTTTLDDVPPQADDHSTKPPPTSLKASSTSMTTTDNDEDNDDTFLATSTVASMKAPKTKQFARRPPRRSSLLETSFHSIGESMRRLSVTIVDFFHHPKDTERELTDAEKIPFMLSQLTAEELETAACTSYQYLKSSSSASSTDRRQAAAQMAQRYLESKKGNVPLALTKMKATLEFRTEKNIVDLQTAFDGDTNKNGATATKLAAQLACQKLYVQGYDKEGRATFIFKPRLVKGHDAEWTLKESLYTMERAIACSKHPSHAINAVVDFSGFNAFEHSPPLDIGKQFLTTLRNHYAGQVHRIFLLDAPASFNFLWNIFQPFIGSTTRNKIVFVSGKHKKTKILGDVYDTNQASSWMLPGGTLPENVDIQTYLYDLKFDQAFSE